MVVVLLYMYLMDCNVESVQIKVGKYRPFIVTSLYRPPGKPVSHFQDTEKTLSTIEADGKEGYKLRLFESIKQ